MKIRTLAVALPAMAVAAAAQAACPADIDVALAAARYANMQPAPNPPADLGAADAVCARAKFVSFLSQQGLGKVVGYKAGLTNTAVQKRFNFPEPVRGTQFEKMLVQDGAEVPAKFGTRPLFEADMIVEVKDAGIMNAKTPLDVLAHASNIYPFMELPDLIVEDPSKLGGTALLALNVGARKGVLGKPFAMKATPESVAALAAMKVKVLDQDGKELDAGSGDAILGNPLNAVLWLVKDLKASGITLKKGDLLSLGSFSKLMPPKPGLGVKVVYEGLPGNPSVSVRFR
jgi:2-keto-4-pentenoate hydratase